MELESPQIQHGRHTMEMESPQIQHGRHTMELESPQIQDGRHHSSSSSDRMKLENADNEVAQEIRYLDQVLDAASSDTPTNGSSSPSEPNKGFISIDGTSPSVHVSASSALLANHAPVTVEGQRQTTFLGQEDPALRTNGHAAPQQEDAGRGAPRFELRAFQEERRPAKLFTPGEEAEVRVRRTRPSDEVHELERERQELIKDQAVKKNPVGAQRWWNPPQEVPLEDQLDPEKLESHRKYQERKQQKQSQPYTFSQLQLSEHPTAVTFDPELTRKEDIMEEQIDFTAARKQFLLAGVSSKRDVTPQIYSAKPFSKHGGAYSAAATRAQGLPSPGDLSASEAGEDEGIGGEFTCARAVMTILRNDDEEGARSQSYASFHPEESDSGLDELSLRSQDTTIFSMDNISDSGASLPPTPLPLTPVSPPYNGLRHSSGGSGSPPTEEDLEYHAGVLVHHAIQNALASAQNGGDDRAWHPSAAAASSPSPPPRPSSSVVAVSPAETSPLSSVSPAAPGFFSSPELLSSSSPVHHPSSSSSPQPTADDGPAEVLVEPTAREERPSVSLSQEEEDRSPPGGSAERHRQNPSPPPPPPPQTQAVSPPPPPPPQQQQRSRDGGGPRIKIQSSYARALAASTPAPGPPEPARPVVPRPTPAVYYHRPPSPPRSPERPEFSYFSKYSEAAELRSTAAPPVATRGSGGGGGPEAGEGGGAATSGPFRLRSRKQRTLSMIEEEIRAAQQREEELREQRDAMPPVITVRHSTGGGGGGGGGAARTTVVMRPNAMSTADKVKSNSLPARLTLTARTAPGKIEKVGPAPPVSPSTSEGTLSDAGSEDSSGSRAKNYMQTLMEDYETHKVKKKENLEDNSVLGATRVTRRKSNMALKWEAGIYANEDGDEEEEEEEEEE